VPFTVNAEESLSLASQQEVSQDDLKTFAEAYAQVSQVYNVYENRIIKSKEPGQATALQQEANQKMNQAVRNHGLSIEDYNSIHRMIEKDPSLKQQLTQLLIENP
jgi:GTP1/Obg family GTP-binding protein